MEKSTDGHCLGDVYDWLVAWKTRSDIAGCGHQLHPGSALFWPDVMCGPERHIYDFSAVHYHGLDADSKSSVGQFVGSAGIPANRARFLPVF
jgi:hypothetical protein